ncbi:MAG: hypothetical protein RLZZ630_473 [Bacteroidota bacterium]|jgi:predicted nucleotidyltransferase
MSRREEVRRILGQLKNELSQRFSVSSIGIFGSVARMEDTPESDIDIIVDFSKPIGIEFIDLAEFIEKHLKQKIDLVSLKGIKERNLDSIKEDLILV